MNDPMADNNSVEGSAQQGISPVTGLGRPWVNAKAFVLLAAVGVLIAALGSWALAQWSAEHRNNAAQHPAAGELSTAASAGVPPLKVIGAQHGMQRPSADMTAGTTTGVPAGNDVARIRIPAIDAQASPVDPIVRPSAGSQAGAGPARADPDPFNAPTLLMPAPALQGAVSSGASSAATSGAATSDGALEDAMAHARARLEESRARLEQVVKGAPGGPGGAAAAAAASKDDEIKITSTGRIGAARLAAPALTLARGTTFACALANRIVSELTGPVSCVVARNVYGSDGRVLLIERGSHLDGSYHAQVKVGQSRVAVLWERLRMPDAVVVDLASPATGQLGEAGVDGAVDNHWPGRIGAALLLSLIDDAVKLQIAHEQAGGNAGGTVLLQGSGSETSTLAGKVLDSTVNIAPTIVKNPGEIVAVNVARDVDFSTVYELHAAPARASTPAAQKLLSQ